MTAMFSAMRPTDTPAAWAAKNAGTSSARTINRAEHGTSGRRRIVRSRAERDSMTRAPNTAGTLQPAPTNIGRKLLPRSPIDVRKRSSTNAARAM